jgi:hypothetical protein
LANDLECEPHVLSAIIEELPDCDHCDIAQGGERFYTDANYERISEAEKRFQAEEEERWYENRFTYQWDNGMNSAKLFKVGGVSLR